MGGAGAQPELTCAIVVAAETKGKLKLGQRKHVLSHFLFKFTISKSIENLKKHFRPKIQDFFNLESQDLEIYTVKVPAFCTLISGGKCL